MLWSPTSDPVSSLLILLKKIPKSYKGKPKKPQFSARSANCLGAWEMSGPHGQGRVAERTGLWLDWSGLLWISSLNILSWMNLNGKNREMESPGVRLEVFKGSREQLIDSTSIVKLQGWLKENIQSPRILLKNPGCPRKLLDWNKWPALKGLCGRIRNLLSEM